jgi:hypothetical protein
MARNKCVANGDTIRNQFINEDEQILDAKTVSEDCEKANDELLVQCVDGQDREERPIGHGRET